MQCRYHRITPIELHQCTKFGVASTKFPRTGGPLSNKVLALARAACISQERQPEKHTDWGSIRVTCMFETDGVLRLACWGGKRAIGTKHLHVHCTCTLHSRLLNRMAPSAPCQGLLTHRVWCPELKISLHRRTLRQKTFPPLARAACTAQKRQPQKHTRWGCIRVTCKFETGDVSRLTYMGTDKFLQAFTRRHVPLPTCVAHS